MIEPEVTAAARQRLGEHFPAETNTHSNKLEGIDTQQGDLIRLFLFFQTKENMLKISVSVFIKVYT
jgi:hypothetical protein